DAAQELPAVDAVERVLPQGPVDEERGPEDQQVGHGRASGSPARRRASAAGGLAGELRTIARDDVAHLAQQRRAVPDDAVLDRVLHTARRHALAVDVDVAARRVE